MRDEVFVIMSFAHDFEDRWHQVIRPAVDAVGLKPNRVDYNTSGESVVYDILDGIANSRLVLADITSVLMCDAHGILWPQRNGNVMWEVGIAHTLRLPDEVLLVRSDIDPSIFDLTQFRAFPYAPTDVSACIPYLTALIRDRLRAVDQAKSQLVNQAARAIDALGIDFLFSSVPTDGREFTITASIDNGLKTPRLFDLGIIEVARFEKVPPSKECPNGRMFFYRLTQFGSAVLVALLEHVGFERSVIDKLTSKTEPSAGGSARDER